MLVKAMRWITTFNAPSYVIFFVTARCNAKCKMCFYKENMESNKLKKELTIDEYEKISRNIKSINVLGISGGEPFLRDDLHEIVKVIYRNCSPLVVDLPTNGFFTQKVLDQVEEIVAYCKNMVVDLQLSIDGPREIHDEIRGVKEGFNKMRETYERLILLRKKHKNLRVKACVVYSHYNQDHIEELFNILGRDFSDLDRVVFSVVHGSVSDSQALGFNWNKYFEICDKIRANSVVKNIKDLHSVFTIALRIAKNDFLKEMLKNKNMYRSCKSGQSVIVINETGTVFPCEPLWHSVGELRDCDYDIQKILRSDTLKQFKRDMFNQKCTCHWGLPMSNSLMYNPKYYPKIVWEMLNIICRSASRQRGK